MIDGCKIDPDTYLSSSLIQLTCTENYVFDLETFPCFSITHRVYILLSLNLNLHRLWNRRSYWKIVVAKCAFVRHRVSLMASLAFVAAFSVYNQVPTSWCVVLDNCSFPCRSSPEQQTLRVLYVGKDRRNVLMQCCSWWLFLTDVPKSFQCLQRARGQHHCQCVVCREDSWLSTSGQWQGFLSLCQAVHAADVLLWPLRPQDRRSQVEEGLIFFFSIVHLIFM